MGQAGAAKGAKDRRIPNLQGRKLRKPTQIQLQIHLPNRASEGTPEAKESIKKIKLNYDVGRLEEGQGSKAALQGTRLELGKLFESQ